MKLIFMKRLIGIRRLICMKKLIAIKKLILLVLLFFVVASSKQIISYYKSFMLHNKTGQTIRVNVLGKLAQLNDGSSFRFDALDEPKTIEGLEIGVGNTIILWTNILPGISKNLKSSGKPVNIDKVVNIEKVVNIKKDLNSEKSGQEFITYKTAEIVKPKDVFLMANGEYFTWTWEGPKFFGSDTPKLNKGLKAEVVRAFSGEKK